MRRKSPGRSMLVPARMSAAVPNRKSQSYRKNILSKNHPKDTCDCTFGMASDADGSGECLVSEKSTKTTTKQRNETKARRQRRRKV